MAQMIKVIKEWFAKLANEHPFVLAWGIIFLAIAFVSRLNDVASWKEKFDWLIQHGTHEDKGTHLVVSSPWFFGVVFALVVTWTIWLMLYAQAALLRQKDLKARNERETTAYKTLQGMMGAAARIRDRLHPPQATPKKRLKSVCMVYLISKDFTTEVTREYEVQAVNETLHYWNLSNRASRGPFRKRTIEHAKGDLWCAGA